jgi:predicted O-methyltransferase YrrM
MIRKFRPKQIIEIGAGYSTLWSLSALTANGSPCMLTSIEPYPQDFLKHLKDKNFALIEKKVEHVPLTLFEALEANDILFIDSSHVVRIGGDVLYEVLEIIPRLKTGVRIHVHDIFLPYNYPKDWVTKKEHSGPSSI